MEDELAVIESTEVETIEESAPPIENEETTEEVQAEQPKNESKGFQKRINKITADKYREQNRAEAAERELAELKAKQEQKPEPKLEDFDYDEEALLDAKIDYRVNSATAQYQQSYHQKQQEAIRAQAGEAFAKKVEASGIEDYSETIENLVATVPLPHDVVTAIQGAENGPELAYYLGKNLDVADKLIQKDQISAAMELGRISAKLSATNNKRTTKAPDPVKTAASGGTPSKDMESMSMEEIYAL